MVYKNFLTIIYQPEIHYLLRLNLLGTGVDKV